MNAWRAGQAPRMTSHERHKAAMVAASLAVVMCVAAVLRPDPRGYGTHQQLGLPPCAFMTLFGARCPTCGMTTAWTSLAHGDVERALRANVGGTALAGLGMLTMVWLVVVTVFGRWWPARPSGAAIVRAGLMIAGMTLVDWSIRLASQWL